MTQCLIEVGLKIAKYTDKAFSFAFSNIGFKSGLFNDIIMIVAIESTVVFFTYLKYGNW